MVNALNYMANLAIKGHATRGEEVIEILEMLGGNNPHNYSAHCGNLCFYLGKNTNSIYYDWVRGYYEDGNTLVFTLEEFLEKYPYKVGDKVRFSDSNTPFTISRICWDNNASELICTLEEQDIDVSSVDLQPYKEETMYKVNRAVFDANAQCCDISNKIIKKETMEKERSGAIVDRFICLEGYDFYDDKGNIIDTKEITMKKKQPKYPKTFVECAKILDCFGAAHIDGYKNELLEKLQELIICRDAYWKIAGEKMGLGKPLEPDWSNAAKRKYCIVNTEGNVLKWVQKTTNKILAFPTEEMRDAFYENFKELIEECKELL